MIEGVHLQGRSNADVEVLFTMNSVLHFVPLQIFDTFLNLKQIIIHNAELTALHFPWRNCESLTTIRFSDNNLPYIAGSIFEACSNVTTLSLLNSQIQQIDQMAFNQLYNLETLVIEQNTILSLHPDTFETVPNLQTLSLQNNNLGRIHSRLLLPLHGLTTINFNGNYIEIIEPVTFINLPLLREIHMDNNQYLYEIQPLAFALLEELEILSIRGANLTELNSKSFLALPNLRQINLRDNNLAKIERNFFGNFPGLASIDFRGNDCVDGWKRVSQEREAELLLSLEECFYRFDTRDDQTTTTTIGASSATLSFALMLSALVVSKLSV